MFIIAQALCRLPQNSKNPINYQELLFKMKNNELSLRKLSLNETCIFNILIVES